MTSEDLLATFIEVTTAYNFVIAEMAAALHRKGMIDGNTIAPFEEANFRTPMGLHFAQQIERAVKSAVDKAEAECKAGARLN